MRGLRVSKESRKLDAVLVAARYDEEHKLLMAQGYARSGSVWGDIRLFERMELVNRVKNGERIVTGEQSYLPGDFDVYGELRLEEDDNFSWLSAGPNEDSEDQLRVPLF